MDIVRFESDPVLGVDGKSQTPGAVVLPARLFRAGAYPDKGFELSTTEMDAAIAEFRGAPMNVEHRASVLDGHVGRIVRVWREGAVLHGEVEVPSWLRGIFGTRQDGAKISMEWDRRTKRIRGGAWTLSPRVADAMLAAFSRQGEKTYMTKAEQKLRAAIAAGTVKMEEADVVAMFAEDNAAAIAAEAESFVDAMIRDHKVTPAEKPGLLALFCQAAHDDARGTDTVTFSATGADTPAESRVALLRDAVASRPAMPLGDTSTNDALDRGKVVFGREKSAGKDDGAISEERRKQLLAMTPLGRAVVSNA